MSASIVVPIYPYDAGIAEMAVKCLRNFRAMTPDAELIAIHNGGLEDDRFRPLCDGYIRLDPNQGYSPAVNAGIEASTRDVIVVGSHDTFVHKGWLPPLLKAIKRGVGIASCTLPHRRMDYTGAIFAFPRSLYEDVGPLDEGELRIRKGDQDFAIRAYLKGYRIEGIQDSHFTHDESGTRTVDLQPDVVERETQVMIERYGAARYRQWRRKARA